MLLIQVVTFLASINICCASIVPWHAKIENIGKLFNLI